MAIRPRAILERVSLGAQGVKDSVVIDTGDNLIRLDGDQESPGNNKVYGTNASGVKSWKADVDATIGDGTVTNAKLVSMTQATVKGRASGAGTGVPQDLTAAQLKAILVYLGTEVANTPAGSIAATTVQAALNELDAEKQPLADALTDIGALGPTALDVLQYRLGHWSNRTPAQLVVDLGLTKSSVGLGNVDNTSDDNKPVSIATGVQLDNRLKKNGGLMSGAIAMGANKITGLADGTNPQDAVTKSQLDSSVVSVWGLVAVSATTYTALAANQGKIHHLSNASARTITLPPANTVTAGWPFWFKDAAFTAGTANVTINAAGADTFEDTSTSFIIAGNGGAYGLYSDGSSKWFII